MSERRPFDKNRPFSPRPHGKGGKPHGNWNRRERRGLGRSPGVHLLYGFHSVREALVNPRRTFIRLLATENALVRLTEGGLELPIEPEIVRPDVIGRMLTPDAVHQGVLLEASRRRPRRSTICRPMPF
jgi:23S rRNA (guanosine2251-2'-O)-methyltransferase